MAEISKRNAVIICGVIFLSLLLPAVVLLIRSAGSNEGVFLPGGTAPATVAMKTPWVVTPVIEGRGVAIEPAAETSQVCVYTVYYWAVHPEAWRAENILIGEHAFSKTGAVKALKSEDTSLQSRFLKQFLAVALNSLAGADHTQIESYLGEASDWLNRNLSLIELTESESQRGEQLVVILDDYNNGLSGPALCPDQPLSPTPTPSPSPSASPTTVVNFVPPVPVTGKTAESTKEASGDQSEPSPTSISNPTARPTLEPTSTSTPAPAPSDTPRPSKTSEPTATPTPVPSATPRSTPTPTPAPTQSPEPTNTTLPSATLAPSDTSAPSDTPAPSEIPTLEPSITPQPSDTAVPIETATAEPTQVADPTSTVSPAPSDTPVPAGSSNPTHTPKPTHTEKPTHTPKP